MGGATYPAGVTGSRGETLALSTTLASLGMPGIETKQAIFYNPAVDFRLHYNPAIRAISFYDASASAGSRFKDLTRVLTDRQTTGSGTTMDDRAAGDRLYICTSDIIGGFYIDMVGASVNGEASVLTLTYWDGSAFTTTSATDNTASGGASFAQDGTITFTAPDALSAPLGGPAPDSILRVLGTQEADAPTEQGFWWRFAWTLIFDADTEVENIWTLNKDTNRGYYRYGQEYHVSFDRRNIGAIEAVLAASTDTMEITWIKNVI